MVLDKLSFEQFNNFFNELKKKHYWVVNGDNVDELYSMLNDKLAISVAEHGKAMPNFEIKFCDIDLDRECLDHPNRIILNKKYNLFIAPFEIAIPFKLKLGSDKDIADARLLYKLFSDKLDKQKLNYYARILKIKDLQRFIE